MCVCVGSRGVFSSTYSVPVNVLFPLELSAHYFKKKKKGKRKSFSFYKVICNSIAFRISGYRLDFFFFFNSVFQKTRHVIFGESKVKKC